jgi:DNA-directed RNA polymerase specialized sigma24 family protein
MRYAWQVIPFPATHRSVLERIRSNDAEERRIAFGDLAEGYWRPSYHYLRLHWRLTPEAAEDAVQAFFTTAFEKGYVERFDPAKARFRTFLRVCLDRFVQNQQKAERADKRGGGAAHLSLDFAGAELELEGREIALSSLREPSTSDLDRFFHDETVRALFGRTVAAMERAYATEGKPVVFRVFERHDLRPSADASYASVARELGLSTSQVTNYLHAARRRFRELALQHLRSVVASEAEFKIEARELFGIDVET